MKSSFHVYITHLLLTFVFIWTSLSLKNASAKELGQTCNKNEDCTNYLSYCSDEKKCECQGWTVARDGKCLSEYNNFCIITGGGCTTTNAKCIVVDYTSRCLCPKNYEYHLEKNECLRNNGLHSSSNPVTPSVLLLVVILSVTTLLWTEI